MSGDFLDSNVFVYVFDNVNDAKRRIAVELIDRALANGATISFQVVQEVLNTLRSKGIATALEATRFLDTVLEPLWSVMPSSALYEQAMNVHSRYRFSFYDSLIIAAALESGATRLYSEDLQDGQRIEQLTIENPFAPR